MNTMGKLKSLSFCNFCWLFSLTIDRGITIRNKCMDQKEQNERKLREGELEAGN